MTIRFLDEVVGASAPVTEALSLELDVHAMPVRDLIAARVRATLAKPRKPSATTPWSHGRGVDVDALLGRPAVHGGEDDEIARAWRAFEAGEYFLVIGARQVEDLDEVVVLDAETDVTFLRLLPIVGG